MDKDTSADKNTTCLPRSTQKILIRQLISISLVTRTDTEKHTRERDGIIQNKCATQNT